MTSIIMPSSSKQALKTNKIAVSESVCESSDEGYAFFRHDMNKLPKYSSTQTHSHTLIFIVSKGHHPTIASKIVKSRGVFKNSNIQFYHVCHDVVQVFVVFSKKSAQMYGK